MIIFLRIFHQILKKFNFTFVAVMIVPEEKEIYRDIVCQFARYKYLWNHKTPKPFEHNPPLCYKIPQYNTLQSPFSCNDHSFYLGHTELHELIHV